LKINEINIAAFGGIKNLKITPESGLNIIYGDNENGKSTVMAFIKMMFYGNGRNLSDIGKNMRKKYTPWDGSPMAGSIDFTHSGRNYRIEREFRKSDNTDRVTLCDLDLGTRTTAPSDLGKQFFGLTATGFERSVFIGQFGFPEGDPEGEIGKKLSNIALTGEESVSFEIVNTRLSKAKTSLMSKSGNAGAYDKNIKAIAELKERYSKAVGINENYRIAKEKLTQAAGEIAVMQKKADELKKKISAEQDVRNAQKLKNLLELKAELDKINEGLMLSDGTVADENYVKMLQFQLAKVGAVKDKIAAKEREIEILLNATSSANREEKEAERDVISKEILALENQRQQNNQSINNAKEQERNLMLELSNPIKMKKKTNPVFLISGGVLVALAVVLAVLLSDLIAAAAVVGIIGIILFVLGFAVRPVDKKALEECKNRLETVNKEISGLSYRQNDIIAEISVKKSKLENIEVLLSGDVTQSENNKVMLAEGKAQVEILKQELTDEGEKLRGLFARYKKDFSEGDIKTAIEKITAGAAKQKETKQQINYILKDVGNISYKEAEEKLKNMSADTDFAENFDALKSEYEDLLSRITEAKTSATAAKVRAEEMLMTAENHEELKKQITKLTRTAQKQSEFCEVLQIAMDVLAESNIEVRRSFGSALEKDAAEILSRLTNGKYAAMSVSKTLDVAVEETDRFGSREVDYLSSGTADQAYLSLRLAISSLMSGEGENLPILMDDALAQYDDQRMKTALQYLAEYGENNQIILFTCHKWLSAEAEKVGATVTEL